MTLPTLVLVHGAWHSPLCFDKIISFLSFKGYKCIAPQLASSPDPKDTTPAATSNEPDIKLVQSLILAEISKGNDVVLLGHSSGGVISSSAVRGSVPSEHQGKVLGLIFIAAFLVPTDSSIIDFIKSLPPPKTPVKHWSSPDVTKQWSLLTDPHPTDIVQRFYHDVPREEALQHVGMLRKQALTSMTASQGVYAGWKDVPSWFLLTTEDKAMAPERQREMVRLVMEEGADMQVREIETGHMPFLSKMVEVVSFVEEAVAALQA